MRGKRLGNKTPRFWGSGRGRRPGIQGGQSSGTVSIVGGVGRAVVGRVYSEGTSLRLWKFAESIHGQNLCAPLLVAFRRDITLLKHHARQETSTNVKGTNMRAAPSTRRRNDETAGMLCSATNLEFPFQLLQPPLQLHFIFGHRGCVTGNGTRPRLILLRAQISVGIGRLAIGGGQQPAKYQARSKARRLQLATATATANSLEMSVGRVRRGL